MAKLSREDVLKLAKLARLELTQEELDEFSAELPEILAYVEKLQTVDTSKLSASELAGTTRNVTRPDEVKSYGYEPA
ncbi:MAG: Asp-tRNA(Asn)/Glu-tRNA(Gln) amidotransferase subunit GatC, partial [Candidatus Saccharimonadales bacterium]